MATKKKARAAESAYEPTAWKTGDTITAALLNKAEDGIAAATEHAASLGKELKAYETQNTGELADLQAEVAEMAAASKMQADMQAVTVMSTFEGLRVGMVPTWNIGAGHRLRGGFVEFSATAGDVSFAANTTFCTGLELDAGKTYSCIIFANGGAMQQNTIKTSDSGKSLMFTAELTVKGGTTAYVYVLENDL